MDFREQWFAFSHLSILFVVIGSNIYAGTYYSGVFLSTNNGAFWTQEINRGLPLNAIVNSLAVTGGFLLAGTSNGGIFRDSGNIWIASSSGLPDTDIHALMVIDTYLYAATNDNGLFRSTNNGSSWTPVISGLTEPCILSIAVNDSSLFVGTNGGGAFIIER